MQADKELWIEIGTNDQQAFKEIYRIYYRKFYNYGRKFTGDEQLVEDVAQETLLTIWEKRHSLTAIEYPGSYFYASFRYSLFSRLRHNSKTGYGEEIDGEPDFSIEQIIVNREADEALQMRLQQALAGLTSRQREVIFLRFYEGLSYDEAATVLNITTKATYKIMGRALDHLKLSLAPSVLFMLLHQSYFSCD